MMDTGAAGISGGATPIATLINEMMATTSGAIRRMDSSTFMAKAMEAIRTAIMGRTTKGGQVDYLTETRAGALARRQGREESRLVFTARQIGPAARTASL